jgi:hypothetical protein
MEARRKQLADLARQAHAYHVCPVVEVRSRGPFRTEQSGFPQHSEPPIDKRDRLDTPRQNVANRVGDGSYLVIGVPSSPLVFPSSVGTHLDDHNVRKVIAAILTKAEVRQRRSIIHSMRHTFASLLLQQGESLT